MGYDVHITRAEHWTDSENMAIDLADWLEYLRNDPEMRLDGAAAAPLSSGETLTYENEGLAVWTAYSRHEVDGGMAWFDHQGGRIVVKNPDEEILHKMRAIAEYLEAHVQGDDGEDY